MLPRPDPETAIRVGWIGTGIGLLIFIVSALGEYLGWWDLVGEVGLLVGTVLAIVLGVMTWFSSASSQQVREVGQEVQAVGQEVRGVHQAVRANGVQLEKLDKLDVIQAELDVQTGVMDEQLSVLRQIRDAS